MNMLRTDRAGLMLLVGILAAMLAHDAGIAWWRDWEPGDAADIGLVSALIAGWVERRLSRSKNHV